MNRRVSPGSEQGDYAAGAPMRCPREEGRALGWGEGRHGLASLRTKDGVADQLDDLRNYGVSELLIAVYPSGNPMTCSPVSGTGYRWPSTRLHQSCQLFRSGFGTPRLGEVLPPLNAVALGVGHNPHSVAKLSGTSVGSRYAMPFRIIPERGQVSENSPNSPSKESCDVFHDDDLGSKLVNQSAVLGPQPASCAIKTRATTCETNVLAGKSSSDSIRDNPVCSQLVCGKLANISIDGYTRVAIGEASARFTIELAERDGLEPASAFQPEREAADAAKKVEKTVGLRHLSALHRRGEFQGGLHERVMIAFTCQDAVRGLLQMTGDSQATLRPRALSVSRPEVIIGRIDPRTLDAAHAASSTFWVSGRGVHGSTASNVAICASDRSDSIGCRQPVERMMWIASGREGSRFFDRIMLAYDWLMPVASRSALMVGTLAIPSHHIL